MSGQFAFHVGVAFIVPLSLQLAFQGFDPRGEPVLSPEDRGYEDYIVFLRQFLISAILATAYYINLKTYKTQFIRRCLHEMNEKSIGEVLDEVDEPILIIK